MNKILKIALVILLLIGTSGYVAAVNIGFLKNPLKVIDPNDPDFDPEQFRLEDYKSRQEMRQVAHKLFDGNSTKDYIELMLVERGGSGKAQDDDQTNNYRYHYNPELFFNPKTTYRFSVTYNEKQKPICFQFNGETIIDRPCKFYGTKLKPFIQNKEN